MEEERRQVLE